MSNHDYTLFGSGAASIPRPTSELNKPSPEDLGVTPLAKGPGVIDVNEHPSRQRGGGLGPAVTVSIFGVFLVVGIIAFFILFRYYNKRRRKQEEQMQIISAAPTVKA